MANWAAGNSGVGPGVNKRVFRIIFLLVSDRVLVEMSLSAGPTITEYTDLWFL
jgi:hypothetical protein